MGQGDVDAAAAISDRVHGAYTEKPDIYAERLRLYPAGCFLLERDGEALGYLVTHPWAGDRPPALDQLIGVLPDTPDRYYLHDLALLPEARGTGAAAAAVDLTVTQARVELEDVLPCAGCERNLVVYYHVSRRQGVHLGFMVDAEEVSA